MAKPESSKPDTLAITDRTRLRRQVDRGHFDRATVYAILDAGFVCHLAFTVGGGPCVLPTAYGREEASLYVHGASGNRMFRAVAAGGEVCIGVTIVDGLVLARSAFHHSVNYRSVTLFGTATRVEGEDEKRAALETIVDHVVPGRSRDVRPPTPEELRATLVLRFPITEASAKVRAGGPVDDPADLELPIWGGHVPLGTRVEAPVPDAHVGPDAEGPAYVWRVG